MTPRNLETNNPRIYDRALKRPHDALLSELFVRFRRNKGSPTPRPLRKMEQGEEPEFQDWLLRWAGKPIDDPEEELIC